MSSDSQYGRTIQFPVNRNVCRANGSAANSLIERVTSDVQREMLAAWQAGEAILAEQWLDRHPEVKAKPEMAVLVIYEELCLREERGEHVDSAEIYDRFPHYKDALSVVHSCHRLMHTEPANFPAAGEEFGEFRLLHELGRGGGGRVFLATQPLLSDRPLVVKLTPCTGYEHLSLARLQHTHIVPLFLVQEFPDRNLRALCMPFLGGASWSALLHALASCPTTERSGERIVQMLRKAESDLGLVASSSGPAARVSVAGNLRASHLLDRFVPGRRFVSRARARTRALGHQTLERAAGRRWSTDALGFSSCP